MHQTIGGIDEGIVQIPQDPPERLRRPQILHVDRHRPLGRLGVLELDGDAACLLHLGQDRLVRRAGRVNAHPSVLKLHDRLLARQAPRGRDADDGHHDRQ